MIYKNYCQLSSYLIEHYPIFKMIENDIFTVRRCVKNDIILFIFYQNSGNCEHVYSYCILDSTSFHTYQ